MRLQGVDDSVGFRQALGNLDLTVERGIGFGFLERNRAGPTTTLYLLLRLPFHEGRPTEDTLQGAQICYDPWRSPAPVYPGWDLGYSVCVIKALAAQGDRVTVLLRNHWVNTWVMPKGDRGGTHLDR